MLRVLSFGVLLAVGLGGGGPRSALATEVAAPRGALPLVEGPRAADAAVPDQAGTSLVADGRLVPRPDGTYLALIQPEFRSSTALRDAVHGEAVPGLHLDLVAPRVVSKAATGNKPPPTHLGRLLLHGSLEAVEQGRALARLMDRPRPSLRLCLSILEVLRVERSSRGGSVSFDRDALEPVGGGIFRGYDIDFRPDELLRSTFIGSRPFEGTTLRFGEPEVSRGQFDLTLSALSHRGEASLLLRPNLVLTEGIPAHVSATREVPSPAFSSLGDGSNPTFVFPSETVGLRLEVEAVRIGRDSADVRMTLWLRVPAPVESPTTSITSIELRERRVQTQLTLHDGRAILFSGLRMREQRRSKRRLPGAPAVLDPVFAGQSRAGLDRELWFHAHAFLHEGAIDPDGVTHHARWLREERLRRLRPGATAPSGSGATPAR